ARSRRDDGGDGQGRLQQPDVAGLPHDPHAREPGDCLRSHPRPRACPLPGAAVPRRPRAPPGLLGRLHRRGPRGRGGVFGRHGADGRAVAHDQCDAERESRVPRGELSDHDAVAGRRERPPHAQDGHERAGEARSPRSEDLPLPPQAVRHRRAEGGDQSAAQGLPARLRAGRGLQHPVRALILLCLALSLGARAEAAGKAAAQQNQQNAAAAAAAAGAGAVIVAAQAEAGEDPFAFPAPTPRARQWLGYASPWTLLILAGILITLAALIKKVDPRRRKRIRRASILYMLYLTTFVFAAILGSVHAEGWARRVWFLADLFEVLVIID